MSSFAEHFVKFLCLGKNLQKHLIFSMWCAIILKVRCSPKRPESFRSLVCILEMLLLKFKKFGNTERKIYDLVKPITDELEYFLWDVSFVKEGAVWYLRIFIDRDEGISIDDCERVTEPVNEMLDREDPIEQSYILEVGSAGLERELVREEHFEACTGDTVQVKLIRAVDGEKDIIGTLLSADRDKITVRTDESTEKEYRLADIAHVKLYLDFA